MSDALLPVYDRDLVLVKGKGARLWDSAGHEWLDFAAGIAVNGLGYGDRKVVSAIKKQAEKLIHASNLYHTGPGSALAQRLVSLAFPSKVFFGNSGTEAWEGAMKFARRIGHEAGRTEYVCFENSFHGRTLGSVSTTWTAKSEVLRTPRLSVTSRVISWRPKPKVWLRKVPLPSWVWVAEP